MNDRFVSDNPIFSIDIHPDGKRFATGGQGTPTFAVFMPIVLFILDCRDN